MDQNYWDAFYATARPDIQVPSSFASHCIDHLEPRALLYELGCGNGRDALFFARRGLRVLACDQSHTAIEKLSARDSAPYAHPPTFVCADFLSLDDTFGGRLDAVYSRFTLHAVEKPVASHALAWAQRSLREGGRLFIEARSVKGALYGRGEPRERDAFVCDGHYRRFLRRDELAAELASLGFDIVDLVEAQGLAVFRDDDPMVIRVIAEKR